MVEIRINKFNELTSNIICSGRPLDIIAKEIENTVADGLKQISDYKKGNASPLSDIIEDVSKHLLKINELIGCITWDDMTY